jgi:DNA-binding transcriptional LysR family regulator
MQGTVSRDDLDWNDVRLFLALCRSRTVGAAAKSLRVDASTVSRRLVVLEEALAANLFDRGRDGVTPTKAAEDLLPVAEEIEHVMMRFSSAAAELEREVSGLVRITCPPDIADVIVAPLLEDLFARHPALRIEIDPGEAVLDLTRREADIALRTVRPSRGDLVVTRLAAIEWMLAASPKLARKIGTLRKWSDVPWVAFGERLTNIAPSRWLAEHVGIEPVVRSDSLMVQLTIVARGVGVALVPAPSAAHYGLVPVELTSSLRKACRDWPSDELFLVTHRALRDVPRVRVVWECLLGTLRDHLTSGRSPSRSPPAR